MAKILVSNCLLGCPCRYKGDGCQNDKILSLAKEHTLIGVCPEQAGGLPTPRAPSEIQGDRIISKEGKDVTEQYMRGAQTALYLSELNNVDFAILKAKSPSCGKGRVYDGTFTGGMRDGNGVTVDLLEKNGIPVYSEDELDSMPL